MTMMIRRQAVFVQIALFVGQTQEHTHFPGPSHNTHIITEQNEQTFEVSMTSSINRITVVTCVVSIFEMK